MHKKTLLFILLASISASAQLQRYDNFAATTASASGIGNLTQVIPNATITVFNQPAVGVSCAGGGCTAAATFTSRTGGTACGAGVPLTRPTSNTCLSTTDLQGNFGFWAAAGAYQYCVAATSLTTQCYNILLALSAPNRQLCDQFAGATFDVQVNACIAAVIAQGGGIADATGLIGAQTGTTEIDVGSNTVSGVTLNHISVTLLLSPYLVYSFTSTTAGACAFKVFDQSRLIGTMVGTTYSAIIANGSASTATGSLVCTNYTSTGNYVTIQGVQLINRPGGASNSNFTNGAMFIKNTIDNSSIRDVVITNGGGIGLQVESTCCATNFFDVTSDGGSIAGSKPVVILSLQGDAAPVNEVNFYSVSADHPGTGLNAISIKHTFTSVLNACSMSFFGLYIESNNTDTASDLVSIDSCETVKLDGFTAQYRPTVGSITGVAVRVNSVSQPAINPNVTVSNFLYSNSSQLTCPYTVLAENFGSFSVPSNANCTLPWYSAGDGFLTSDQMTAVQQFGVFETGAGGIPAVNRDVCRGSSANHAIQCSYNNGTFFNQTQTIGTGSVTTAGTAINTLTCQAQTGITVTGAATTDNVVANIGAALPATWQTGIVLSAHVTATNTVTVYLCNPTATATITPAATQVNVRVTR